jgi:NADH-quinone oxidoreductase subunit L
MALSTLAIAGMPPFSGFFSKDAILLEVAKRSWPIYGVGALTALMTAFYMTRLMYKTFMGTAKTDDAKHTHEAPFVMTGPLIILGILATVAGALSLPAITQAPNYFGEFLAPATTLTQGRLPQAPNEPNELLLLGIAVVIALVGIIGAWVGYKIKDGRDLLLSPESKITNPLYKLLLRKWYVDEIYYAIFTVGGRELSYLLHKGLDIAVIDGIVNGDDFPRRARGDGCGFNRLRKTVLGVLPFAEKIVPVRQGARAKDRRIAFA